MNNHTLTPIIRRVKRFVRNFKPELRVRTQGEIGLYADSTAAEPKVNLKLDQDYALPLLKAVAIVAAIIALVELCDD